MFNSVRDLGHDIPNLGQLDRRLSVFRHEFLQIAVTKLHVDVIQRRMFDFPVSEDGDHIGMAISRTYFPRRLDFIFKSFFDLTSLCRISQQSDYLPRENLIVTTIVILGVSLVSKATITSCTSPNAPALMKRRCAIALSPPSPSNVKCSIVDDIHPVCISRIQYLTGMDRNH